MQLDLQRTIVAVGSGVAPAPRAIVRISGQATRDILKRLTGQAFDNTCVAAQQVTVALGWGARRLKATVLYWPDQRSYTGEPCAELHVLGSLPIVESLVEQLLALGAAPAERGEFTLRSFLAGKLDLTQAEAVLGVIEAESSHDLSAALKQLGGNLSQPVRTLRDQLLELTAHLEAGLDFVEEDIEFISEEQLARGLQQIANQLQRIADQLRARGARTRQASIVLVGLPNAGKSSLFNALVGKDRTIVSPLAGTTRDAVTASVTMGELTVELIDTAGVEELNEDSPRGIAQQVLVERLRGADVALWCIDLHQPPEVAWLTAEQLRLQALVPSVLRIGTKADLLQAASLPPDDSPDGTRLVKNCHAVVTIGNPSSVQALRKLVADRLIAARGQRHSDAMHATATRCRNSIELALSALQRALDLVASGEGEELVATELRIAIDDLSSVIGEVHNEDILGEIFSRFCIGK